MERKCSACRVATDVTPVAFAFVSMTFFVCTLCHGAWRIEAMALGSWLSNNARVYVAFTRWLPTRRVVA